MIMAQEEDSSSYGNKLEVKLEAWKNGSLFKTVIMDTTTIYNKDSGAFYYPKQVLYKANTYDLLNQNKEDTFKLVITNKETGKIIRSKTLLTQNFDIKKPSGPSVGFTSEAPVSCQWTSAKNGKKHQLVIRFNYKEVKPGNTDTAYHYVDWIFGTLSSSDLSGGEIMTQSYTNSYFYDLLEQEIPVNTSLKRYVGKKGMSEKDYGAVEYIVYAASDDFSIYMDVAAPSTSIVQEKPPYTNITNESGYLSETATGIFASRYRKLKPFKLQETSIDELETINRGF
jgi:hypothetical protein